MPVTIMQIWINDKSNANFPVVVVGINASALYDTGANMSYMSHTCYTRLKAFAPLRNRHASSVHSAMGHDLIHCGVMLGNTQFMHTFIVWKALQKELVIGLDIQHLHCLCCHWTKSVYVLTPRH